MSPLNEIWTADVLGMENNPHTGIDLIGKDKDVEVKFTLQLPYGYRHKSWRVLAHELEFNENGKPCFWALGFYKLTDEIKRINITSQFALERRVTEREIFIVEWNWMNQYPKYHHVGETRYSKWNHWMMFPKYKDMPKVILTHQVSKGKVHITEDVPTELFQIKQSL